MFQLQFRNSASRSRLPGRSDELYCYISGCIIVGSASGINVGNGRYSVDISGLEHGKTYSWTVTVNDDDGPNFTVETFTFTTKSLPPWMNTDWLYRKAITIDPTQVSGDQTDFQC